MRQALGQTLYIMYIRIYLNLDSSLVSKHEESHYTVE